MSVKLSDVVKKFNGDGKANVVEWLTKVELVAKLQDVKDLASFIPLFLEDDAFAIYSELTDEEKADYGSLKAALVTAFSMTPYEAFEVFKRRSLKPGENPEIFLADLRRLMALFGKDSLLACQFVTGMPESVSAQLKVHCEGSTDLKKLMTAAKNLLKAEGSSGAGPLEVGAAGKRVRIGQDGKGERCSGCLRPGHAVKDCKVTCFGCGKKGHYKRNCPDREAAGNLGEGEPAGNDQGEAPKEPPQPDVSPYPLGYRQ